MWPFKKKSVSPPIPYQSHQWSGERADAVQLQFYVNGSSTMDRSDFQLLDTGVQGLITAFYDMAKQSLLTRNRHGLIKAWRYAQQHVYDRQQKNRVAFMSVEEHKRAQLDQSTAFHREAIKLFGAKAFINLNGQQVISTREGGGLWYLGQLTLVVLNPVKVTREITTNSIGGNQKVTVKKTMVTIDPGLFDDFIKLTPDGIIISNPDLGSDEFLVPWAQAETLILSTNATMLVDPINSWIRPMFRGTAQSPWVPFGTITVKDRQSGQTLVTALMIHPDRFRDKLQALIKNIKPHAVSPDRVDPVPPVDLDQFMTVIPGSLREEMIQLLQRDGGSWRRKFSSKNGEVIFTFRGQTYADEKQMYKDIEAAMKTIVRETHPDVRIARMRALQELASKVRPFVVNKALLKLLDKIINSKV